MSEDEAKTKWCPHARVATYAMGGDGGMAATNKVSNGKIRDGARCIGSECMAWRWQVTRPEIGQTSVQDTLGSAHYTPLFGRPQTSTTDGYCGLAGAA